VRQRLHPADNQKATRPVAPFRLCGYPGQNVTAVFAFVQKLSQAKSFEQVVKIQTEFMETQMNSFNEQAKILGEIYNNAAQDAMKTQFGMRK